MNQNLFFHNSQSLFQYNSSDSPYQFNLNQNINIIEDKENIGPIQSNNFAQNMMNYKENFDYNSSYFNNETFLNKKTIKYEDDVRENNKFNLKEKNFSQNSGKKYQNYFNNGKPLKEINFNGSKNHRRKKDEMSSCSILQMAIKEKNDYDQEEKERKKIMKIQMIKMHQRNRYLQNQENENMDMNY